MQYLGRYSHRVAITNSRIITLSDSQVSFLIWTTGIRKKNYDLIPGRFY
ncbi:MAG: transposase [Saprospiraceae bacterium]|nr:transposase [Saprospiraceae bacterium]